MRLWIVATAVGQASQRTILVRGTVESFSSSYLAKCTILSHLISGLLLLATSIAWTIEYSYQILWTWNLRWFRDKMMRLLLSQNLDGERLEGREKDKRD
ncbi:hypothetical protein Goshw_009121 [Gossypium schwendimanii]|uniref:Uncharacterized protein n=1 Tax=Gossypium schwendimanii TaxID=34291 RepID=A0A7J9MMU8_GOSSC|nr:hypothetical protein [Gossypium schwendimanii]